MKNLLIAVSLFLLVVPLAIADSHYVQPANIIDADAPKKTTFSVTLSATYNAVSADVANKLAAAFVERHEGACKNKVVVEQNGSLTGYATSGETLPDTWSVIEE